MGTTKVGGDRIGSGAGMTVETRKFSRANFNLNTIWKSTMSAGTLVPFMKIPMMPGQTLDIDMDFEGLTLPTLGPLFGSFKVQLDVYRVPMRLYNAELHNNDLEVGMDMSKVKIPKLQVPILNRNVMTRVDLTKSQTNASSLLNYLGIKGMGKPSTSISATTSTLAGNDRRYYANAIPFLSYWDIFKNYYANKQEVNAWAIHTIPQAPLTVTGVQVLTGGTSPITVALEPNVTPINMNIPNRTLRILTTSATSQVLAERVARQVQIRANGAGVGYNRVMSARDYYMTVTYTSTYVELSTPVYGNESYPTIIQNWINVQPKINEVKLHSFPLKNLDTMRKQILRHDPDNGNFVITQGSIAPYGWSLLRNDVPAPNQNDGNIAYEYSQECLAVKTYQSDIFNNYMNSEWITGSNGINAITAVNTSSGSFTMDALNMAQKVYMMLNRIAISGGDMDGYIDAVYDQKRVTAAERPVYEGGMSKELVFNEVFSTSTQVEAGQPLGTLAGKGTTINKKGGKVIINTDEWAYAIGIISLTPRLDYSQGNDWDMRMDNFGEWHKPDLDQIGFQDLLTDQMLWSDTTIGQSAGLISFRSVGKQPAWMNYQTNYNRSFGHFAEESQMWMTLNRRYEVNTAGYLADGTTYIDPAKFNDIFASSSLDSQNFWAHIKLDIRSRQKMSAKQMPNL